MTTNDLIVSDLPALSVFFGTDDIEELVLCVNDYAVDFDLDPAAAVARIVEYGC